MRAGRDVNGGDGDGVQTDDEKSAITWRARKKGCRGRCGDIRVDVATHSRVGSWDFWVIRVPHDVYRFFWGLDHFAVKVGRTGLGLGLGSVRAGLQRGFNRQGSSVIG